MMTVQGIDGVLPEKEGVTFVGPMLPRPAVFQKAFATSLQRDQPVATLLTSAKCPSASVPLEQNMYLTPAANSVVAFSVIDATQKKQRSM